MHQEQQAPASSDTHTRDRFQWLDQVLADHDLTPFAFQVAYVIASHVNRETGEAWPSQARIAEAIGGKERGVRSAVEQLAVRGHLLITTPEGRKGGNRYRLARGCAEPFHRHDGAGKSDVHRHSDAGENPIHRHGHADDEIAHRHGDAGKNGFHRHGQAALTGMAMPPNPYIEPSDNDGSDSPASQPRVRTRRGKLTASNADFDTAYELYPRHKAREAARKAYASAISHGATPAEILAGVQRYAVERTGEPERYTAHMASWINARRWTDAPDRPAKMNGRTSTRPTSGVQSAMAGIVAAANSRGSRD